MGRVETLGTLLLASLGALLVGGFVGPDPAILGPDVAGPETAGDGKGVGLPSVILGSELAPPVSGGSIGKMLFAPLGTALFGTKLGLLLVAPVGGM